MTPLAITIERADTRSPLASRSAKRLGRFSSGEFETDHLARNGGLDSELVRLVVGARHQRHAADAGRKAEIILDACRCAGLTAERAAIQHQHGQSLRRRVNRSGKAGRSRADDGDIVKVLRIDRADQSDAARQLVLARIAQHLSARTDHDRQLPRIDVETVDQRLGLQVGFGIEVHARRAVAGEKAFEPNYIGVFGTADDDRAADAILQHLCSAQDQRAHQPFAKLRFGDQQGPHTIGREDQRLDRLAGDGVAKRRPAGELGQFAEEGARAEREKMLALAVRVVAIHVDLPVEDDAETDADLADRRQRLARGEAADLTEAPRPLDVRRIEQREDLVTARVDDRRAGNTHAGTFTNARPSGEFTGFCRCPATWSGSTARRPQNIDHRT